MINKVVIIEDKTDKLNSIIAFLKSKIHNIDFFLFENIENTTDFIKKENVNLIISNEKNLENLIIDKLFNKISKIAILDNSNNSYQTEVDAFVEKPINKNILLNLINILLKLKNAENSLNRIEKYRKNNLSYSEIINSIKNAFILIDDKDKIIEWNNSAERIFGISKQNTIGKNYKATILNRSMRADLMDIINGDIKKNYSKEYLINIKSVTGKKYRVLWNITRLVDNTSVYAGVIAIGQDVTGREKNERDLKKNEKKLKYNLEFINSLLNSIPSPVYFKNINHEFIACNDEFAKLFNLNKNQIIGKTIKEILYPEEFASQVIKEDEIILKTGNYQKKELVWNYTDGSTNNFVLKKSVFYIDDKIEGLVGIMAAVTEIKEIEKKLRNSELFYKSITDSANDAIVLIDKNDNITFWNLASENTFLLKKKEVINKNIYKTIFNINQKKKINSFKNIIFEKNVNSRGIIFQLIATNKEKRRFPVEISMSKIYIEDKISYLFIIKDITERKIYEEQLVIAKEKAEESDSLKSSFLSNMSHEIRTPMNAIVGFSQLLTNNTFSDEKKKTFVEQININSESLMKLIEDIIYVSKIETGKIEIKKENCKINTLLEEIKVSFIEHKRRMGKEDVELILNKAINNETLNINTDKQRLRQIFTNLLGNALKFTDKGYVEFGYKLKSDNELIFYVKDTGLGINSEKIKYVFDRFTKVSAKKTKLYGGTGLGLSISKHLVERLGGEISVKSKENEWSIFEFTHPFKHNLIKENPIEINISKKEDFFLKNKKILIAEDEEMNFIFLRETIIPSGAQIDWAKNGKMAVDLAKKNNYDIILMDIKMPIMDGYEATNIIKKTDPKIPIIAQTAYAIPEEQKSDYETDCDFYLSKPIDPQILIKTIKKFIK